jgi:hypothetical protein
MARKDTTIHKWQYTCDRCGDMEEPPEGLWARIMGQLDGPADTQTFLTGKVHSDMCPRCIEEFKLWWARLSGREETRWP